MAGYSSNSGSSGLTDYESAALALDHQKLAWQQEQDRISNELARGNLTLQQAMAQANEAHNRITEQQTQRSQDIGYATTTANTMANLLGESLPYLAPAGTSAAIGATLKGNTTALPSAPFPYDPSDFMTRETAKALAGISPYAAQVTGQSNPVFVAPSVETKK